MWAPLIVPAFLGFIALGGWVVQQLWNGILPTLFQWPRVTFWQALGLLALCRILFGGFALHGDGRGRRRGHHAWESLTPEERERFRRGVHERWGAGPAPGAGGPAA
jgi:hypothetical protein